MSGMDYACSILLIMLVHVCKWVGVFSYVVSGLVIKILLNISGFQI